MEVINYSQSFHHHRNSHIMKSSQDTFYDSGFDSILMRDDNDSLSASPIKHCMTPSKTSHHHFTRPPSVTTPNKRQIFDLDGIYYACLRSPSKSPQNYLNTKNYVHERDTCLTNLLRSPVISDHQQTSPNRIIRCRPFATSTQETKSDEQPVDLKKPFTTPTQDEFIELLYKHHLPSNPECLIGRQMGVDYVDIFAELNRRSMFNVADIIMRRLKPSDYANMYRVSKTWKNLIQSDKKINRQRVKFIKYKKEYIEATKVIHTEVD
jgi:hypothetical protein